MMGSDHGEPAEAPLHRVSVGPFWMDRREVSVDAFAQFVACDPRRCLDVQRDLLPGVSRERAQPGDARQRPQHSRLSLRA